MSTESRLQLKTYFETGDIPTEQQFCNFIESTLNLNDDCVFIPRPPSGQQPKVGIGTPLPTHKLDVTGDLKTDEFIMPTGAMSGYVLTTDDSGYATWEPAPTSPGQAKLISLEYKKVAELKAAAKLDPGCIYCIPDAGTNRDQMVLLTALADNELSLQGWLIAKNADYQGVGVYSGIKSKRNLGVWYNTLRVPGKAAGDSAAQASFRLGETLVAGAGDESGTGIYGGLIESQIMVLKAEGTWKQDMVVVGQESGFKAVISGGVKSELQPNPSEVVIWNNYHYQNLTGENGTYPDKDPTNWKLVPKNTKDGGYITEVDFIEFDFEPGVKGYHGNGWMQRRTDRLGNDCLYSTIVDNATFRLLHSALDLFRWGSNKSFGNFTHEAVLENRNDRGTYVGNILERGSEMVKNTTDPSARITGNVLQGVISEVRGNTLLANASLAGNTCGTGAMINSNFLASEAKLQSNLLAHDGGITSNSLSSLALLENNSIGQKAFVTANYVSDGSVLSGNTIDQFAMISRNELAGAKGGILRNTMNSEASIDGNTLIGNSSLISRMSLGAGANIVNNMFKGDGSALLKCVLGPASAIANNSFGSNGSITHTEFEGQALFNDNTFDNDVTITNSSIGASVAFSNKALQVGVTVDRCHFGCKFVRAENITSDMFMLRCEQGFSNFVGIANLNASISTTTVDFNDAGHYLPEIAGVFVMTTTEDKPASKTLETIIGMSTVYPVEWRGEADLTVTMVNTPVASATGGKFTLVGGVDFELVGRTAASDFMVLRDDAGTIRETNASKLS